jgi:Na+-transporting NADH:ubiquinone oxidoreductase subunit C
MSIDKEGNGYTMIFAIIMVVVVGGVLAFVASTLKPIQQENVKNEKMQNILQSIGIKETASVSRDEAGSIFNKYVKKRIILDYDGNVLHELSNEDPIKPAARKMKDQTDAFNVDVRKYYNDLTGLMKRYPEGGTEYEAALKEKGIVYPLFVCENEGKEFYITYFSGKGLWDDIWGYISLQEDGRTINGSVFDHKGETPGLGSKITEPTFNNDFLGKVITNEEGEYRPIKVLKPGLKRKEYQVQGLSGATFTHVGVEEMMERSLAVYHKYLKSNTSSSTNEINKESSPTMENDSSFEMELDSNAVLAKIKF